jgi:hypothetical protein
VPATDLAIDIWQRQSLWSRTANRMKQRIENARAAALGVSVAVAVLGTVAGLLDGTQPVASRVCAGLAAFGAALLPVLRPAWSGATLRNWTRARSVSEALKSEVYLWLARVGEYCNDEQGATLLRRTDAIGADGDDLLRYQAGIEPAERSLPPVDDVVSYFEVRVAGQIDDYYQPRARHLERRLSWFRRIEIALAVLGAALGATAAASGGALASWIPVLTTVGAAVAVHVASSRYDYQLLEFLRTANQLAQLRRQAGSAAPEDLDGLAQSAEAVISVENQGWMAKLAEEPPDHAQPPAG